MITNKINQNIRSMVPSLIPFETAYHHHFVTQYSIIYHSNNNLTIELLIILHRKALLYIIEPNVSIGQDDHVLFKT